MIRGAIFDMDGTLLDSMGYWRHLAEQYLAENKAMKDRGGYYSKFRHAFIFRIDPTEILKGEKTA